MRTWICGIALLSVPLLTSSASTQPTTTPSTTPPRLSAALAGLDSLATTTLSRTGVPGMAVAVVYRDRVLYLKGFGVREIGKPERVDPDTVFQIASMSKPISSTVVAALVGDGVLGWDDPIIQHDPGFELFEPDATREVTVRDMFSHNSGLPEYAGDLLEDMGYGRAEILRRLRFVPLPRGFRGGYAYTNYGITSGAVAAAMAAGKTWEEVIAERLYRPLGMTSTSSRVADYRAARNRASIHALENGKYVAKYQRNPDPQAPAGGVSSSVRDLARWVRLQLGEGVFEGRRVVAAAALAETHRPQVVNSPPADPSKDRAGFYGLGWDVSYDAASRVRLSHSGAFAMGVGTVVVLAPSEELGIVVLTNGAPRGVPEALAATFFDSALEGRVTRDWPTLYRTAYDALIAAFYGSGTDYSKPPARPSGALPLASYTGTYANDLYGPIEVATRGTSLVLLQGPRRTAFTLRHYDRDVFVYQPTGESAAGLSGVTFRVGPDGRAASVVLENLDGEGLGTFMRAAAR